MKFLQHQKEYYSRFFAFVHSMNSRWKKLNDKHIDKNGHLHLPIYIKSISQCQDLMVVPDEEMYAFLEQIERALKMYKTRLPANIYVYTPDTFSDEFRELFLRCIQNVSHVEYIARLKNFLKDLISLAFIFILGNLFFIVNSHLEATGAPEVLTSTLSVISTVMVWELIDYLIRVAIPALTGLRRIIQIATAKITIRHWD